MRYCRPEPSGMARAERDYLTPIDERYDCREDVERMAIPGYDEAHGFEPDESPFPRTLDAILADCPEEG